VAAGGSFDSDQVLHVIRFNHLNSFTIKMNNFDGNSAPVDWPAAKSGRRSVGGRYQCVGVCVSRVCVCRLEARNESAMAAVGS
jgi:hypothetical protein